MSWLIVGTIPYQGFPLVDETCYLRNGKLSLGDHSVSIARGTPALLAAACRGADALGLQPPRAVLAGDIGRGDGSALVYQHLLNILPDHELHLIIFHYLQPDIDWHNRILMRIEESPDRPLMVADAGYMYVAKMSGFATAYDLFTPDVGEMAFLADELAPHPFYTRGFLLQEEDKIPELIDRAYRNDNAACYLLVKGRRDLVASRAGILAEILEPCVEAMEPIGGTGDTVSGLVATMIHSGNSVPEAAALAARVNRLLGRLAQPTPACSVAELIPHIPRAIELANSNNDQRGFHGQGQY